MKRLWNQYVGKRALIVFGGPSLLENDFPFACINKEDYVVFAESKALTSRLIESGLGVDYLLGFYLEKCKTNALQHVYLQSFCADIDLKPLLKEEYVKEYESIRDDFLHYCEEWKPHKGVHKRYRYRPNIVLKGSPLDNLKLTPGVKIVTSYGSFSEYGDLLPSGQDVYLYDIEQTKNTKFDFGDYIMPKEQEGKVVVSDYSFVNSASIALFPLMHYMGFSKVVFLGMDMSMLGSMEFAACFTFKSMKAYEVFYKAARRAFGATFKPNIVKFKRPSCEIKAMRKIFAYKKELFCNVYKKYKYAWPIKGIENVDYDAII